MILKLIGSLIVLVSSSILGYIQSRKYSQRPSELRTLQALLQMFENEISFLSNVLTDAFEKISKCSDSAVSSFFSAAARNLRSEAGLNAYESWKMAVEENISRSSLYEEDKEILVSFGKLLGGSDIEGQIKNIRLTISQLKLQEQKAEELRRKNEGMFRNLGVLGGLAIIIILF